MSVASGWRLARQWRPPRPRGPRRPCAVCRV